MNKLFLLDGFALIFRAYYAFIRRPMVNSKGVDMSAVFGFTKALIDIILKEKPTHLAVGLDPGGKTFRHEIFPQYKANREETPEVIRNSIPMIRKILDAFQIPICMVEGYEADDVLGTVAKEAERKGIDVMLVTSDKDFGQLVSPHIWQYKPGRSGDEWELLGVQEICEKYSIDHPEQVIDILAIQGDVSDNVPGVPGIGEVGAKKLISVYKSVENVVAHLDELPEKQRRSIAENEAQLKQAKKLITINTSVPFSWSVDEFRVAAPDLQEVEALFREYEFYSLRQAIPVLKNLFCVQMRGRSVEKVQSTLENVQGSDERIQSAGESVHVLGRVSEAALDFGSVTDAAPDFDRLSEAALDFGGVTEAAPDFSRVSEAAPDFNRVSEAALDFGRVTDAAPDFGRVSEAALDFGRVTEAAPDFNRVYSSLSIVPLFSPNASGQDELRALAICIDHHQAHWLPCPTAEQRQRTLQQLKPLLESPQTALIGYMLKPLLRLFFQNNIAVHGDLWDIELMHYLLNPERSHNIEVLSRSLIHIDFPQAEALVPKQASLFDPVEERAAFSDGEKEVLCVAACASMKLYPILLKQLQEENMEMLYREIEMPLASILALMELEGITLDIPRLKRYGAECKGELNALSDQIRSLCNEPHLNISSPKQLGVVLFEKLQLDPQAKRTPGKQYATDEETLHTIADKHPIVPLILDYRSISKLLSTYIDPLPSIVNPATGRIHTTFNQALTATGRLSSQKPNMQNIPIREERGKELRRVFTPRSPDYLLLSADYSQIELRIMAHLSQDPHFIEAFRNGEDIHLATAAKIYHCPLEEVTREQRNRAKTANFGIIYGISSFGLSQRLHIPRAESKALIEEYFRTYVKVKEYIETQIERAGKEGFVSTLFHRRRYLPDIHARNGAIRSLAERNAVNAPIQGSAADIIKIAMVRITHKMAQKKLRSRMILQVHDELVFDMYKLEKDELTEIVQTEMEQSVSLDVPLIAECGVGEHWLAAH